MFESLPDSVSAHLHASETKYDTLPLLLQLNGVL